jgi:hypothetical protein
VRIAPALAAAVAVLALPAAAHAQLVTLRGFPGPQLVQGPNLAGERVAWSSATRSRFEVFAAGSADPARRLFRAPLAFGGSGPDTFSETYSLEISGYIFATMHETLTGAEADIDSSGTAQLRAGPTATRREVLFTCRSGSFQGSAPFAVDESRLAYDPDPCDGAARIVVRDFATELSLVLPEPAGGAHLRLRGRYAAWIADGQLVVHDVIGGFRAYTAPATDVAALDLDGDGTVVACSAGRLLRHSAATPAPIDLGAAACESGVRIDARRIFFVAPEGIASSLRLLAPDGTSQELVRFGRVEPGRFDFAHERLAWTARDCGGGEAIFTATLTEAPVEAGSINCRARFRSGIVRVRRGVATVRLRCPRGCGGELSLRHMGTRRFSLLRGENEVRLRLRPRARARLERRGSLEGLAKIVTHNRAGDRQARSRAVTLVRSP